MCAKNFTAGGTKVKIIYKSDITGKEYDSEKELIRDEAQFKKAEQAEQKKLELAKKEKEQKIQERTNRAKEIEEAYKSFKDFQNDCSKQIQEKWNAYLELRNKFISDYGEYHTTYRNITKPISIIELFNDLFRF